ncbi:hypothetical protein B0H13DRAFT_2654197 [Mycena leptocephala]|nr:hypothetical protein B0H13DRAFT_2654197 [Mycena leptocephala]
MNTFVSFVLLAVCTIAAVPSVLSTPLEKRANFSVGCHGNTIDQNGVLSSTCTNIEGQHPYDPCSQLCIGVLDGKLVSSYSFHLASNGSNGFLTPCQGLFLSDAEGPAVTLVAKCINDAANTINNAINLDAFVDNSNGVLKC